MTDNAEREAARRKRRRAMRCKQKPKRLLVMERFGYMCARCGETNRKKLTIDHIVPKCRGGTNERVNLQVLCKKCNNEKGDKVPVYAVGIGGLQ